MKIRQIKRKTQALQEKRTSCVERPNGYTLQVWSVARMSPNFGIKAKAKFEKLKVKQIVIDDLYFDQFQNQSGGPYVQPM